jgi:hypothetical protein
VEIGQAARLPSGTVHPILAPRRYYRLTTDGVELARSSLARAYSSSARAAWLRPAGEEP